MGLGGLESVKDPTAALVSSGEPSSMGLAGMLDGMTSDRSLIEADPLRRVSESIINAIPWDRSGPVGSSSRWPNSLG